MFAIQIPPITIGIVQIPTEVMQAISEWTVGNLTVKGKIMASSLTAGQSASAKVQWVDQAGNPATVDGPTAWVSSDPAVLTVVGDGADSTKAAVQSVGPVGPAQIQATADADLGAGMKTITAVLDVTVIAGEAFGGTIELTPT